MKTKTVGELLRGSREERQISLDEFSRLTKIKLEYLEALEATEFAKLPAAPFVKGYIRTYGQVLGFDHKPLLAILRRDYGETPKGVLVPRVLASGRVGRKWGVFAFSNQVSIAGVIFSVVALYSAVSWIRLQQPPQLVVNQPSEQSTVGPRAVVSGKTDPDAVVSVNSQPAALQSDGSFQIELYLPREGVTTITIESTNRRGKTKLEQRTVTVQF